MELTISTLSEMFDECNRLYFDDELDYPKFSLGKGKTLMAQCLYRRNKNKKGLSSVEIMFVKNHPWNERLLRNVMVHEMVHFALAVEGHDTPFHGLRFCRYCRRLRKKYGVYPGNWHLTRQYKKITRNTKNT